MDIEQALAEIGGKRWEDVDVMWLIGAIRSMQRDMEKFRAEFETLKYRFGNQEDALEAYRELCDQTEKLLPELAAYMVIEPKEYRELLDMYDVQKEPRKYGDGGRPQSACTMANSGDAGEGGRG